MRLFLILFPVLICQVAILSAQNLRVALFYEDSPDTVLISIHESGYELITEDSVAAIFPPGTDFTVYSREKVFNIYKKDSLLLEAESFHFRPAQQPSAIFVNLSGSGKKARLYTGGVHMFYAGNKPRLVNTVPLEEYVAGVVEAEGGYKADPEYYMTQAILCRTYALKNCDRHAAEGFQLCDDTHCQHYPGKVRDTLIEQAVKATADMVLVDESFNLITAVYHSNSGGITANSGEVWSKQLPYLVSVQDSFSVAAPHARWEKQIALEEFHRFLGECGIQVAQLEDADLNIRMKERKSSVIIGGQPIFLNDIRRRFGLKSSFFDMKVRDSLLCFKGRGYGHGVGLSQEGAMEMAKSGYAHDEIIHHYYSVAHIVRMQLLDAFEKMLQLSEGIGNKRK